LVSLRAWPSLADHVALARDMFGDHGDGLVDAWLAAETARIDDPDFARSFADHVVIPGVVARDFNHRHVRTSHGELLGGVRFYGRDVGRPFVEVCCHGFEDLAALRDCVRTEWSAFVPHYLRLHALPGRISGPGVVLDETVHVARYRDMTEPDGRVTLEPFDDVADAVAMVARRYEDLAVDDPGLARNVFPAAAEDLRHWHETDQLRTIRADGQTVGLLAVAPGAITWIPGDEIQEEVIEVGHRGHGYAVAAQGAWARNVAADPDRHLIGTIDRLNPASRLTAERAGRPRIMEAVFVSLDS
jgi:hypothetical protein